MLPHDRMIDVVEGYFSELKNTVIPIYTIKNSSTFEIYGTAFIAYYQKCAYLISAQHVITVGKKKKLFAIIKETFLELSELDFFLAETEDIAIAKLFPNWCSEKIENHDGLDCIKIKEKTISCPETKATRYLLMGFFASNKYNLKLNFDKFKRAINGISFYERKQIIDCNTAIPNAIGFDFTLSDLLTGQREITNIAKLNGNSGGAVFEVTAYMEQNQAKSSCDFIGVFVEYHKREHEIIISPKANIINLIRSVEKTEGFREHI